ncbi:MAG: pyrroline-5-carboxylate reductase [Thermoanaerobaculia bacterium]|nr:pyrroline-5-carboxylate reductase [Thermoanaerobaculia bacterium]
MSYEVVVLGAGKMGGTLIRAWLENGVLRADQILATAAHEQRLAALSAELGIATSRDNRFAVSQAPTILLCVKPQVAPSVLEEVRSELSKDTLVISIVASASTARLEAASGDGVPVVRVMPNTPSQVRAGMSVLCAGRWSEPEHLDLVERLFRPLGRTMRLDEQHMDAVTGLSASGPAFIYVVIESLAEGGVKAGLPRDVATELAAQTVLGAAQMVLETGQHPALLKDAVTTPAGCTVDGLLTLEEGGLRVTLIKAVMEASRRARELLGD